MLGGSGLHRGHIVKAVKAFFFFLHNTLVTINNKSSDGFKWPERIG